MHPSSSKQSTALNHNSIHNKQNAHSHPSDDPLNSIRLLSLADLSVGGTGTGHDATSQQQQLQQQHQQQYNYEYSSNAQNVHSAHSSNHSTHQIGDIIGGSGGGESFNWGSSG